MTTEHATDQILNNLRQVMTAAEDVLSASVDEANDGVNDLRRRLASAVQAARASCGELEQGTKAFATAADQTVRTHPYQVMGMVFAAGLLLGVCVNRK